MGQVEKFKMRVNNFDANLVSSLSLLRHSEDFCDVTLVSDDEIPIQAHKVVLSASSHFFRNVLKLNKTPTPLLYIRGVTNTLLGNLVEFLYKGEASVAENDLDNFLKLSKDLKVTGLSDNDDVTNDSDDSPTVTEEKEKENLIPQIENIRKYKQVVKGPRQLKHLNDTNDCIENLNLGEAVDDSVQECPDKKDISELDAKILELLEKRDRMWYCTICGLSKPKKSSMQAHIERHHIDFDQPCSSCDYVVNNRPALYQHMKRFHSSN